MTESLKRRPLQAAKPSMADIAIVLVGLVSASGAGVAAYRAVGPYGHGPFHANLYRTEDLHSGRGLLYRQVRNEDGTATQYVFSGLTLQQIRLVREVDGRPETVTMHMHDGTVAGIEGPGQSVAVEPGSGLVKIGFSLDGSGVIDAWQFVDKEGVMQRIEVSRRQDGEVDRWEYYEGGQLARVEEDNNRDGKADRWLTYEAGILMHEARDRNGDGQPDTRRRP